MKLTMRDRSQRPQLSVAVAEVGWEGPEAQPLNRSDSTNAFATAKPKILLRLPSFMAFLHLSVALTVMLQPFFEQEASHEWNINIRHTLCGMARVDSDTNRHVRCQPFEIHRRLTRLLGSYVISFGAMAPADDVHEQRPVPGVQTAERRTPFERTSDDFRKGGELEIAATPLYSSLSRMAFGLQPLVQERGHRPSITCPAPRRVARSFSSSMTNP